MYCRFIYVYWCSNINNAEWYRYKDKSDCHILLHQFAPITAVKRRLLPHIKGHHIVQYKTNPNSDNTNTNPHSPCCVMRFITGLPLYVPWPNKTSCLIPTRVHALSHLDSLHHSVEEKRASGKSRIESVECGCSHQSPCEKLPEYDKRGVKHTGPTTTLEPREKVQKLVRGVNLLVHWENVGVYHHKLRGGVVGGEKKMWQS